jgi:hypothetical protein
MGNHCHMIVIPDNQQNLSRFYGILQKSCTDWLKSILGYRKLSIWDPRPSVIALLDPTTIARRISYIYANPARAKVTGTIGNYTGLNSHDTWMRSLDDVDYRETIPAPRLGAFGLPNIKENTFISKNAETEITALVSRCLANEKQTLIVTPNAWKDRYGASNEEVRKINHLAQKTLREEELKALSSQSIRQHYNPRLARVFFPPHIPKKFTRRVFVISDCSARRTAFIKRHDAICEITHRMYQTKFKFGVYVQWPAGVFIARPPIHGCAIQVI